MDSPLGESSSSIPIDQLKEVFSLFDEETKGQIKPHDLGTVIRGLGKVITEKELTTLLNKMPTNGDGNIDFPDFVQLMSSHRFRDAPPAEQIMQDFAVFDRNNDGHVDAAEFVQLLQTIGEPLSLEDVHHLMQEVQIDGDKRINVKEFVQHMYETSAPSGSAMSAKQVQMV